MTVLRVPPVFCARFLGLQIHYLWMSGFFQNILKRHINQASISNRTLVQNTILTMPPAKEQLRIVERIDALFVLLNESVALMQRAKDNTSVLQKLIIRCAVTGTPLDSAPQDIDGQEQDIESASALLRDLAARRSRVPPVSTHARAAPVRQRLTEVSFGKPFLKRLPAGWVWTTVQELGEVRLGRQRSPKHQAGPHPRPYLRVANVLEDRIDISDVKTMNFTPKEFATFCLKDGDILLNEGQSVDLVGRPAMFRDEIPGAAFKTRLYGFVRTTGSSLTSLYWYFDIFYTTASSGKSRVGLQILLTWPVPLSNYESSLAANR